MIFERQLHESEKVHVDLLQAREKILTLEQEKMSLQAAVDIHEKALKDYNDAQAEIARTRQDQDLYQASIADILTSARQLLDMPESLSEPSPSNLRLVWSRLHSHWTKEAHKVLEIAATSL